METTDLIAIPLLSETPDGALLARYLWQSGPGSEAAFAEIGRRYARLVYNTCLHERHHSTLAEDAAPDARPNPGCLAQSMITPPCFCHPAPDNPALPQ